MKPDRKTYKAKHLNFISHFRWDFLFFCIIEIFFKNQKNPFMIQDWTIWSTILVFPIIFIPIKH